MSYPVSKYCSRLFLFIAIPVLASCSAKAPKPASEQSTEQSFTSAPPFQTKEPETYRAVRTLTFADPSGKTVITKTTISRFGAQRREEVQTNSSPAVIYLELMNGRFVLYPNDRVYADVTELGLELSLNPQESESSPERLLHPDASHSTFQKLGTEVLSGRNVVKYRVVVNTSVGSSVSSSETLMWVDEAVGMPIKSETKSGEGGLTTMELSDISLEVDKSLFQLPAGYQKVAPAELRRRLQEN